MPKHEPAIGYPPRWDLSEKDYPGIFGDPDADDILTADDPHPVVPGDETTVEEVKLSDEIRKFLQLRKDFVGVARKMMVQLEDLGGAEATTQGRVKSPYSIINKLRRARLTGPMGLTDVAGTRLIVGDHSSLRSADAQIQSGVIGRVDRREDTYETRPGYHAIHYNIEVETPDGPLVVEVQLKTKRHAELADFTHGAYKRGEFDAAAVDRLAKRVDEADEGDAAAQAEVDALLGDKAELASVVSGRTANPSDRVSRIVASLRASVKAELGWPPSEFDPLWEGAEPMVRKAIQEKFAEPAKDVSKRVAKPKVDPFFRFREVPYLSWEANRFVEFAMAGLGTERGKFKNVQEIKGILADAPRALLGVHNQPPLDERDPGALSSANTYMAARFFPTRKRFAALDELKQKAPKKATPHSLPAPEAG